MALTIKPIKVYTLYCDLLKEHLGDGYEKSFEILEIPKIPKYTSKDKKTLLIDLDHLTDVMLGSIIDLIPPSKRIKLIITCRSYSRYIKKLKTGNRQVTIQKVLHQNTYNDLMNY